MKQYKQHLQDILAYGTNKSAARENMPSTISLFGYQWRHPLSNGFPLITTKRVFWKGVIVELLWFLKGDTNVKWLNDNGVTFWNEDAYTFYLKKCKQVFMGKLPIELLGDTIDKNNNLDLLTFEEFETILKIRSCNKLPSYRDYTLGDCGFQYGKLWRKWDGRLDQLKDLLYSLKNNPTSRRHILTAWNPATLNDMALHACHALVQFNCRPIPFEVKLEMAKKNPNVEMENLAITEAASGHPHYNIPQYYLDCQMYQRSADMFLGVPLNIASYALLTHIFCELLNMIPGDMIYTYGDSHIYSNHMEQVKEQLSREERPLPQLNINTEFWGTENGECGVGPLSIDSFLEGLANEAFLQCLINEDIQLSNYNPHPSIKGKLSTGM